jgi:thiol-disulfide isomerase/thioredoxin
MRLLQLIFIAVVLLGPSVLQAETLPAGIITSSGKMAPDFTLVDIDGNASSLASGHGQWRFVHFWASWCGPCRKEMPSIEKLVTGMQDQAIRFYLINTAENEDTVFTFLAATAPDLNSLMDRDGQVTEAWQPRGLPATYLVDPQGRLRYQALGGRDWQAAEYRDFLLRLLEKQ